MLRQKEDVVALVGGNLAWKKALKVAGRL